SVLRWVYEMIRMMHSTRFDVVHVAETIRGGIATYLREIIPLQVARFGAGRVAAIVPEGEVADLGEVDGAVIIGVTRAGSRLRMAMRVRRKLQHLLTGSSAGIL